MIDTGITGGLKQNRSVFLALRVYYQRIKVLVGELFRGVEHVSGGLNRKVKLA